MFCCLLFHSVILYCFDDKQNTGIYLKSELCFISSVCVSAGAAEEQGGARGRERSRGEITNKETTWSSAGWPFASSSPERVGSLLLLSPPSPPSLFPEPTYALPATLSTAAGHKEEEAPLTQRCDTLERRARKVRTNSRKDEQRLVFGDENKKKVRLVSPPGLRRENGRLGGRCLRRMKRQKKKTCYQTKREFLSWTWSWSRGVWMSWAECEQQWRMPGWCPPLWSSICSSCGSVVSGWCAASSAPPPGSASRWSSLLSSVRGSAWRATARIPASKATTPHW